MADRLPPFRRSLASDRGMNALHIFLVTPLAFWVFFILLVDNVPALVGFDTVLGTEIIQSSLVTTLITLLVKDSGCRTRQVVDIGANGKICR